MKTMNNFVSAVIRVKVPHSHSHYFVRLKLPPHFSLGARCEPALTKYRDTVKAPNYYVY